MADASSAVDAIYRMARGGDDPLIVRECTPAVTAILWRAGSSGLEVWLGQRAYTMRFMPGVWTFPGGVIAAEDEQGAHLVAGPQEEGGDAVEIAATIRKVREETGVELSRRAGDFHFAGRLITPEVAELRFDTAIYLVESPPEQVADFRSSGSEFRAGRWLSPALAMGEWRVGGLALSEPTRELLDVLAGRQTEPVDISLLVEGCRRAVTRTNRQTRIHTMVPGVRVSPLRTPTLPPAITTNCYIIGDRELVVIDPASPYSSERAALDQVLDELVATGSRVVEIWLTHHHGDHIGGALHLAERLGVVIAAHAETARLLGERVPISRMIEDGETLDLAGNPPRRLRAIHTPGHAPGHLCFLEEETGYLMAGDMVAGVGTIVIEPSEGDMHLYLESLRLLARLDPRVLCPAHGFAIGNPKAKLEEYIQHRLWREERVVSALAKQGRSRSDALTRHAYSDVPDAVHPLAERSLIAHLIKLHGEGRVIRDGDIWELASPASEV